MLRNLLNRLLGRPRSDPSGKATVDLPHVSDIPKAYSPTPPSTVASEPADRSEVQNWIRGQIERDVAAGYQSRTEIVEAAVDCFLGELPEEEIEAFALDIVDNVIAKHEAEQADWPETTDCDRLDRAFRSLEEKGIVARQNFSCCGTCGSSEIWDEIDAAERSGRSTRGYAFFHMQDTESAVEGGGLYLNYGAKEDREEAWVGIGREIQQELEKHGLTTDWDGTLGKRVGVSLDWKKRSIAA